MVKARQGMEASIGGLRNKVITATTPLLPSVGMQTEKKSYVNVALVHFEFVGKAPTMLLLIESRSPGFMLRNDLLPQLKQQQPLMPCQGFVESGISLLRHKEIPVRLPIPSNRPHPIPRNRVWSQNICP